MDVWELGYEDGMCMELPHSRLWWPTSVLEVKKLWVLLRI